MIRVDVPAERKGRVGVANDKSKAFCIRAVFNHSGREGMAQHVRDTRRIPAHFEVCFRFPGNSAIVFFGHPGRFRAFSGHIPARRIPHTKYRAILRWYRLFFPL